MSRRINIFIWVVNDSAIVTLNFIFIRNVIYLSYVKGIIFSRYVFTNNCIEFDREYILGYVKSCSTSFRYFLYLRISAISRYPRMKLDANSMLLEVVVGICPMHALYLLFVSIPHIRKQRIEYHATFAWKGRKV